MRFLVITMLALVLAFAGAVFPGTVLADPENFGGKGKAWTLDPADIGLDYYQHKNTETHTQNFNSSQGAGKRFSQPGKAEGKANDNSVILEDGMHPGTQVLPGGNR